MPSYFCATPKSSMMLVTALSQTTLPHCDFQNLQYFVANKPCVGVELNRTSLMLVGYRRFLRDIPLKNHCGADTLYCSFWFRVWGKPADHFQNLFD